MAITPNTDIRILKTPFEIDNKNQLTFGNISSQTNYFLSLPHIEEDRCTYQRKDNVIRFPRHIDSILEYNYVMYKNENYTNKWFYAYITKMEYVNDNLTLISIETDVFQTWQFDIIYKKMFVEREHVNDDTIGLHTIDENLNIGEVIEEQETMDITYNNNLGYYIAVASNWQIEDNSTGSEVLDSSKGIQYSTISVYNNNIFGTQLFFFDITTQNDLINTALFLLRTNRDGHIADVQNIFILPKLAIPRKSTCKSYRVNRWLFFYMVYYATKHDKE